MSNVTAIRATGEAVTQPSNIEAEQQLLGAILTNNEAYDRVSNIIEAHHFHDPVHARIFEAAESRIRRNMLASPVTLKPFLEDDEGLRELGGPRYLARLAASAISSLAARDYAQVIYDLAIRRDLIRLGMEITTRAAGPGQAGPGEQIAEAEQELYDLGERGRAGTGFETFCSAATDAVHHATAALQRGGGMAGLATGLVDLDRILGGLHRTDLLVLAGRPSMGKTALATNIAFNIAKRYRRGTLPDGSVGALEGGVVGVFSLEMSAEQLASRILAGAAEVEGDRIRRGELGEDELRRFYGAAKTLEACPLHIDDTPALPISQIAARARRLKRTHGLDLLVVDYLQLARAGTARDSRVHEVTEITQGLKAMAKELEIPVLALSQLSRQVEQRPDKRPQLSDLRESGSIEQDADVVMFVYREAYYREREKPSDSDGEAMAEWLADMNRLSYRADLIVGKQRHGPIGTVELGFEPAFTRFGNAELTRRTDSGHGA